MGPQWDAEDVGQQIEEKQVFNTMRGAEQELKGRLKARILEELTKSWIG